MTKQSNGSTPSKEYIDEHTFGKPNPKRETMNQILANSF